MNLKLSGELITDDWAELYRYYGITAGFYCPGDVEYAIEQLEPGEQLILEINSIGGSTDAAAEIYTAIQKCGNPTRAEITGLAASAASYMILSCDEIAISVPAQMMIHCSSLILSGNKEDHTWAARMLDTQDLSILDTYVRRCGEEHREELKAMMEAETFLASGQCLQLGLVDSILGDDPEKLPKDPPMVAAGISDHIVRAMRTLPDIEGLKARREQQIAMDAALEAEINRYIK